MKRLTLILKPTLLCNCSCRYCITPQRIPKNALSLEDVEILCQKVSRSSVYNTFTFIWHGGEPLLLGVDYYKEVLQIQKHFFDKNQCKNTFQTNATLINDDWITFFQENGITVSTSLDGDKESNDINRIRCGHGTFDEVFSAIKRLQNARLLTGVVTVLSKSNIDNVDTFLQFYAANCISTRLNPILPSERVISNETDLSISALEYANCLISCFNNWVAGRYNTPSGRPLRIAPLTEIVHNILNPGNPHLCIFARTCSDSFLAMNPKGELYNCGRFCDIDDYLVADIHDGFKTIDAVLDKKRSLIKWSSLPSTHDICLDCEWLPICNRGCPNSSFLFSGDVLSRDPYCDCYKRLFAYIYNYLKGHFVDE